MQDVSEDMVRAMFSTDAPPMVILVTLEGGGLAEPIRVTSDPDGTVSRGEPYEFFPFTFTAGGASIDESVRGCRLQIGNVDGRIAQAARDATGKPTATVELVRKAAPDDVETAIVDAKVNDIDISDPTATATLLPRDFTNEPACSPRYVIFRTPGLFANDITP
jgi:hypothetical protein